jgi:glycerol-3-phosphate acyltransferase PlsY
LLRQVSDMNIADIVIVVCAYLIGSVSSAIIVCRLMQLPDPRQHGSGNPGATNVLRVGGKKAAAITLLGDMLKGLLPVLAARLLDMPLPVQALAGSAAFLGHLYPVFFGLKGGKGVATMLGVLFGLHWAVGLATALTWLVMAKVFRISSLSALVATLLAPLYVFLILRNDNPLPLVIIVGLMTAVLFWRHRSNIRNLLSGKEGRIGKSS